MANINKIRLSGQTYDIEDSGAQRTLSAGQGITIENNVISATGGGGSSYTAGDGIDITNDVISVTGKTDTTTYNTYTAATNSRLSEDEEVTAAGLNALNESKQDTLVSGTNIKTINNESLLGSGNIDIQGGGSSYTAGRGIDITNDIISFSLPISAGTRTNSVIEGNTSNKASGNYSHAEGTNTTASGSYSHAEGGGTTASGSSSHAEGFGTIASGNSSHAEGQSTQASGQASHSEGLGTTASGNYSHAEGQYTKTSNQSEHASGQYNVSHKVITTFGNGYNTLFSVGNGTSESARHNAFEIRQNGDIYLTLDGQDVKLQDQLGGSSITVDSALSSTSENPVQNKVIYNKFDEVEQVTAAGLNALNDELGGKQDTLVSGTNIKTINNESILGSGNIDIQGGGSSYIAGDGIDITNDVISVTGKVDTSTYNTYTAATDTALASKADTSAVTAIQDSLSGYVTTNTEQTISGRKIFTYSASSGKAIEFKQTDDTAKVGFRVLNSASTNNELATFELRPNTFTINGVQHPLLYLGHYRNKNTGNAGVPQTVIGFRQYDQLNAAAYHYLMPLPEKAKTPFSLTTSFKDYYAPMGFKNGSTMITADNTGVVDLSSELDGLKLKKLSQAAYDNLQVKDQNTLYIIVN